MVTCCVGSDAGFFVFFSVTVVRLVVEKTIFKRNPGVGEGREEGTIDHWFLCHMVWPLYFDGTRTWNGMLIWTFWIYCFRVLPTVTMFQSYRMFGIIRWSLVMSMSIYLWKNSNQYFVVRFSLLLNFLLATFVIHNSELQMVLMLRCRHVFSISRVECDVL